MKRKTPPLRDEFGDPNGNVLDMALASVTRRYADRALVARVCRRLEDGNSPHAAGLVEGLGPNTVGGWVRRVGEWMARVETSDGIDRDGLMADAPDAELFEAVTQIRRAMGVPLADGEVRLFTGDMGPLAWLERLHRDVWGKAAETATVVNVAQGPSELAEFLARLTKE